MATDLTESPIKLPDGYPFHIGTRIVRTVDASGKERSEYVPLSEEDFLHPQEEDRFMIVDKHWVTVTYIRQAIEFANEHRPAIRVFSDHRIDWEVEGILPHGPDVVVFDRFLKPWDDMEGTLPVKTMEALPLAIIEVTSESTRHIDFEEKYLEYCDAGIPYYIIVDFHGPKGSMSILGFRRKAGEYFPMRKDPNLGYFIPGVNIFIRLENENVIVSDEDGVEIPRQIEAFRKLREETARAEAEKKRAETEKKRAETEAQRAEVEKKRADDLARELAELKAKMTNTVTESGDVR
ncbi:MAG: Uma2 family endonuclease [Fimbriiglobus sp.]